MSPIETPAAADVEECPSGKVPHSSKGTALVYASRAMRRRNNPPVALRAYPCPDCKKWHLTSQV